MADPDIMQQHHLLPCRALVAFRHSKPPSKLYTNFQFTSLLPPLAPTACSVLHRSCRHISFCLKLLQPYRISFDKPEYGGIYHQCIYMLCQKEQSTMRAGKQSKDVFKQSPSAYMPHLSLLYSDIDEHVRSAMQTSHSLICGML